MQGMLDESDPLSFQFSTQFVCQFSYGHSSLEKNPVKIVSFQKLFLSACVASEILLKGLYAARFVKSVTEFSSCGRIYLKNKTIRCKWIPHTVLLTKVCLGSFLKSHCDKNREKGLIVQKLFCLRITFHF